MNNLKIKNVWHPGAGSWRSLAVVALAVAFLPATAIGKPHHDNPNARGLKNRCTVSSADDARGHRRGHDKKHSKKTVCTVGQGTPGWGTINRNTFGSPSFAFRTGPYGLDIDANVISEPPFGQGSLNLLVEGQDSGESPRDADKINYANQLDFKGIQLSTIRDLSYWVFIGDDSPQDETVPGIEMEVDPTNGGEYSQLVYLPSSSSGESSPDNGKQANTWQEWEPLADGNRWTATGTVCNLQSPCNFETIKQMVGPDSEITLTFGFTKGRDNEFQGAVDGLTFNNIVYDFEPPKEH